MPRSSKKAKRPIVPAKQFEGKFQIQIVFNSQETERITNPIKTTRPNKVYYILHQADVNLEFKEKNVNIIKKSLPKCEIVYDSVDFVNYHEIIGKIFEIYTKEITYENSVLVINCGTGSKLVAIAAFDAFRLLPEKITLIYTYGFFNPNRDGPAHEGALKLAQLPEFKMKVPNPVLIQTIQYLYGMCLYDPIHHRLKRGFTFINEFHDYMNEIFPTQSKQENTKLLKELRDEWHYIQFTTERGSPIVFTRGGKQIALALRQFPNTTVPKDFLKYEKEAVKIENPFPNQFEYETVEENTLGDFILVPKKHDENEKSVRRIHITYNVKEDTRITKPIFDEKPGKVYYFHMVSPSQTDIYLDWRDKNLSTIRQELPNCEIIEFGVNYVDYYELVKTLVEIIQQELKVDPKTRITINLSTASKMVAMANMDIFRIFPNCIDLVYLYSRNYNTHRMDGQAVHVGEFFNAMIPFFEMHIPDKELIYGMQILDQIIQEQNKNLPRAKNETIQAVWEKRLCDKQCLSTKAENEAAKVAICNQFESKFRIPLESDWKLIIRKKKGKSFIVRFTEEGQKFINVFRNIRL
jgi:hypothetical protein